MGVRGLTVAGLHLSLHTADSDSMQLSWPPPLLLYARAHRLPFWPRDHLTNARDCVVLVNCSVVDLLAFQLDPLWKSGRLLLSTLSRVVVVVVVVFGLPAVVLHFQVSRMHCVALAHLLASRAHAVVVASRAHAVVVASRAHVVVVATRVHAVVVVASRAHVVVVASRAHVVVTRDLLHFPARS